MLSPLPRRQRSTNQVVILIASCLAFHMSERSLEWPSISPLLTGILEPMHRKASKNGQSLPMVAEHTIGLLSLGKTTGFGSELLIPSVAQFTPRPRPFTKAISSIYPLFEHCKQIFVAHRVTIVLLLPFWGVPYGKGAPVAE